MTWYYILYCLFALLLGMTIAVSATFRGSSLGAYKRLQLIIGIGVLAFLLFSVCHFFVIGWGMALVLIVGTLLIAPFIGMKLSRTFFACVIAPYLTIIAAIAFWFVQYHYLTN